MRRTIHLSIAGFAVGVGAVLGASPVSAQGLDCTDEEVAAAYSEACIPTPPLPDGNGGGGGGGGEGEPIDGNDGGAGTGNGGAGNGGTGNGGAGNGGAGNGGSGPSTLPFTGGEVLLVSLVGAGAVAAGTALVVAGRRRPRAV